MTREQAKQRAREMWGEAGWLTRTGALLAILGSAWLLLTAAYSVAGSLFVTRERFDADLRVRDSVTALLWFKRDSAQAVKNVRDEMFQRRALENDYRECVRHHGERRCLLEKP